MSKQPRDIHGKFVPKNCPACDCGELEYEPARYPTPDGWKRANWGMWRCNGLTHLTADSPLIACEYAVEGLP